MADSSLVLSFLLRSITLVRSQKYPIQTGVKQWQTMSPIYTISKTHFLPKVPVTQGEENQFQVSAWQLPRTTTVFAAKINPRLLPEMLFCGYINITAPSSSQRQSFVAKVLSFRALVLCPRLSHAMLYEYMIAASKGIHVIPTTVFLQFKSRGNMSSSYISRNKTRHPFRHPSDFS